MFAVPGWELSASVKTQKAKDQKLRKGDVKVTAENIADLWLEKVDKIHPSGSAAASVKPNTNSKKRKYDTANGSAREITINEDDKKVSLHQLLQHEVGLGKKQRPLPNHVAAMKSNKDALPVQVRRAGDLPPASNGHELKLSNAESILTPTQVSMRKKLSSARFRYLNETLYTSNSQDAQRLFETNSDMFEEYHQGFRQQVSAWPENPVEAFVQELKTRGGSSSTAKGKHSSMKPDQPKFNRSPLEKLPLPRIQGICTVVDLGCGDASLAQQALAFERKAKIKVLSFDLHSPHALVTKADIANLPLREGIVDIAILCLALMGTNWIDFVEEAWRVLHWNGELWIAEIKSRFGHLPHREARPSRAKKQKGKLPAAVNARDRNDGGLAAEQLVAEMDGGDGRGQETNVSAFVEVLRRRGFGLQSTEGLDFSNKMFVRMKFIKNASPITGKNMKKSMDTETRSYKKRLSDLADGELSKADESEVLKPCLYKQR